MWSTILRVRHLIPLVALALTCALGCGRSEREAEQTPELPSFEEYRVCETDTDCAIVRLGCGCCGQDAIARNSGPQYIAELAKYCKVDKDIACSCREQRMAARCIANRCQAAPSVACVVDGKTHLTGASGIKDPFSCNLCTCQEGQLACDEASCPEPCPAGTSAGQSCENCDSNSSCADVRTDCLPTCAKDGDCLAGALCTDGLCRGWCTPPSTTSAKN
jgi:hypothetical protein